MMRSNKRDRLKKAIELMRENTVKYSELSWWSSIDKDFHLKEENYNILDRAKKVEDKYLSDISILLKDIKNDTNWQIGFNSAMLSCSRLLLNIIEFGMVISEEDFYLVDSNIQEMLIKMNKSNRIKKAIEIMDIQEEKHFQLIHYSRMKKSNFKDKKDYRNAVEKMQKKYPDETFELSSHGKDSDKQHGFLSGILACTRLYSGMIEDDVEFTLEEFPFLDT